jgi:hypothetical protein
MCLDTYTMLIPVTPQPDGKGRRVQNR